MSSTVVQSIIGSQLASYLMGDIKSTSDAAFYDFWNNYFRFPDEYTDLIDMMLTKNKNRTYIGPKKVLDGNRVIPSIGKHYFYPNVKETYTFVTFHKKAASDGKEFYMCYLSSGTKATFSEALALIFKSESNKVRVISLDASRPQGVFPLFLDKLCGTERSHQTKVIDEIMKYWNDLHKHHCRVIICGERGSGKSYIGRLLKKRMESNDINIIARLYDDFNPSMPGISFNMLIAQNAKSYTPVIVMVDEVDIAFGNATKELQENSNKHGYCQPHTKDKTTFNAMLDSMSDTEYCNVIFTTEKSPEELYQNKNFHSFMRKGRIDFFVKLTNNTCEILKHSDIIGYEDRT